MTTPGWEHALKAADLIVRLPKDVPLMFRRLPLADEEGGNDREDEFWMGSLGYGTAEEPRHRVRITQPFYLGIFPITQHQWRTVAETCAPELNANPSHFEGDLLPVESVNRDDAVQWCQALQASAWLRNAIDNLGRSMANSEAAFPSEAQWEYACRAGTETEYYTGDGEAALAAAGWYAGNAKRSTHPVGLLEPNDFGLFDMHGNVWEWCRDAWDQHAYKRRPDGVLAPERFGEAGLDRVIRGGYWGYRPRHCRAAYRGRRSPWVRYRDLGFRVCLVSGPCPGGEGADDELRGASFPPRDLVGWVATQPTRYAIRPSVLHQLVAVLVQRCRNLPDVGSI